MLLLLLRDEEEVRRHAARHVSNRPVVEIAREASVHRAVRILAERHLDALAPVLLDRLLELVVVHDRAHRHHAPHTRGLSGTEQRDEHRPRAVT
jgi:hypothetical protein